jgi:PAS domain S-box-containing protein
MERGSEHRGDNCSGGHGGPSSSGEMRARVQEKDWSATALGARAKWPGSLQLCVELILASGFPMAVRRGPDLIMIYNDAYREILGDKHPDALGHPLREVWPEIYDRLGPLNEGILRGEQKAFFAVDHPWTVKRQGARRENASFTISYSPIPDPAAPNGIGGVLTTVFETTHRVRNEERLRELTHTLEAEVRSRTRERDRIWTVSEDLLGVSTFEGYFTSVNPAWTSLLGWTEDEIRFRHVSELRHPDDAEASMAQRARLAQGISPVRLENRFRHKDGSWRWISWTLTADGGLIYASGRNVTVEKLAAEKQRETERQFRLLVAGVTDYALFMLDPHGIITSWNAGAQRIKGYTTEEIVGQHFSRFYTERDRLANMPDRSLNLARKEGRSEAEGWRVRKDGSLFWANVVIDAIKDENCELIGFAKITRDITERREAQSALQKAYAERARLQKMDALGQLTGGVAHDFNNLLMIISGHIRTLAKSVAHDPAASRAAEAIETAAQRGASLTRQLLTFARRQPVKAVPIFLTECLAALNAMLVSSVGGAAKLRVDVPSEVWRVKVDPSEFELALVNLTLNARDAIAKGGVITITAENVQLRSGDTAEDLEGDYVALTVSDTGCGIPPDILSRVFDPFFTTKDVNKGTGLGLSQVHGFAHQSGGTVTIASELGQGTKVTLYLPRTDENPERATGEPDAPGGGTVLLVEDNPDVATVTLELLKQLGYRAHIAADAKAALEILEQQKFDLVISDIVMAGPIDGLGLARTIRKRDPELPVVLVTGYAESATRAAAEFPVLRKPYQLGELSRAAARALADVKLRKAALRARDQSADA